MDRRSFLRLTAGTGLASLGPKAFATPLPPKQADLTTIAIPPEPVVLQNLQNEFLKVTLYSDASASIVSAEDQAEWRMGPVALQEDSPIDNGDVWLRTGRSVCEQYPGRFSGKNQDGSLRFTLLGRLGEVKGGFTARVKLDGPWLEFRIISVDDKLPSLAFPPPIESESLVIPEGIGRWIRKPIDGRLAYPFFSHLNMRWFGGLRQQYGWIAILPEPSFADSLVSLAEMSAAPVWLQSLGKWSEERAVRYKFLRGDYVDLAKTYRAWAIAKSLHRPLTEKAESNPALKNLLQGRLVSLFCATPRHPRSHDEDQLQPVVGDESIGAGPMVSVRHSDVQNILRDLPSAGISRALIILRGWIRGGYDYSHPDIWPPDPALGTVEELRAICQSPDAYTVGLHDNYQDIYAHNPSFPNGGGRSSSGALMPGGYWDGGQAYILNSRDGVKYAQRNWENIRTLKPRAMFIDTTSAVQNYQSYEALNSLTRSQDVTNKSKLLEFFKRQGVVLGSEESADFAVPWVDWMENRHDRVAGESIPLWPLVFHDAVACGRYVHESRNQASSEPYPYWLLDMLWGYFLLSGIREASQWPRAKQRIATTRHVDDWFRQISTAAMIDHKFLSEDSQLEQTVFSNGSSVVVNFSAKSQLYKDVLIRPGGYHVTSG